MNEYPVERPQTVEHTPLAVFSGAIIGLQGDVLHGWAINHSSPEQRVIVEILVDGTSVAIARADQYELNTPVEDNYHGFVVQIKQQWLNEARVVTAQIANQGYTLKGQICLPQAKGEDSASITSQVWHTGGLRVGGWCWDPTSLHRHVQVTVKEGDQVVGQAVCDMHHQALAYRATSDHGFGIDLPWGLADGQVHVLDVIDDLGQPLAGSPIRLCCLPEGIEGVLKNLSIEHDQTVLALLDNVVREQSQKLPKSVGWAYYPQWFEAYQRPTTLPHPSIEAKVGILLISEGSIELEQKSLRTVKDAQMVVTASASNVIPAVQNLIEQGCDRILPMFAGDRLAFGAIHLLSTLLDEGGLWAFSDCDIDEVDGTRSSPWLKPVWDIDFFIGSDIFSPGSIFGAEIARQAVQLIGIHASQLSGSWYDLLAAIALATQNAGGEVYHLPQILYHRSFGSAASPESSNDTNERFGSIAWLCSQLDDGAELSRVPEYPALLRPQWTLPQHLPKVSIIVPTRDQYQLLRTCIEGLLSKTDYPEMEIIVVDNNSTDLLTLDYLAELSKRGVKILRHPHPFNYSTINNRAIEIATGEFIALVNNDIEIIESNWLREMLSHGLRPGVGAVGAKLLWPNGMVQHGGVVVGINGLAAHSGNNLADDDTGYLATNQITRRQQAVTAACLIMRRSLYEDLNGLDEKNFPVAFNDVDLCLRIQRHGLDIIWSAAAKLVHAESASRGKDLSLEKRARAEREQRLFMDRWSLPQSQDPHYHPSLSHDYLSGPYGGLSLPPSPAKVRKNR